MEKINHLPVNWVDGMKISKQDFIALENYLLDQVRDSNSLSLNDYNFGLLPASEPGREALSVDVSAERIELYYCRAVTRAGARIEITDMSESTLRRSVHDLMGGFDFGHSQEWYVVLRVDPFDRVPYGKPAPEANRHLNAMPRYELGIIPREQITSPRIAAFAIPIAKIRGGVAGIEQVKNYVPPCARLNSSPELLRIQQRLEQDLSAILKESTVIVRKVNYRRSRENVNTLAADICQVAAQAMSFLNNNYDAYRLIIPQQPPLMLIEFFARFARTVDTSLELTRGKDDMLNYFQQWVPNFGYGEFDSCIQSLTSALLYNHLEIRQSLDKVENFVAQMKNLLEGLAKLNYEQLPRFDIVTDTRMSSAMRQPDKPQPVYQPPPNPVQPGGHFKIKGKEGGTDRGSEGDPNNPFGLK